MLLEKGPPIGPRSPLMANQEQLAKLTRGVTGWNIWRSLHRSEKIDLGGADLSRVDLSRADLRKANLERADLRRANLSGADLTGAVLSGANLSGAEVREADLGRVELSGVDLTEANLTEATLVGVILNRVSLIRANLEGASVKASAFAETVLGNTNLKNTLHLDTCTHWAPSTIDLRTIRNSWPLPLKFLRGVGLDDTFIEYIPSLIGQPIQFFSCFISYASKDQDFAERLYADLQSKGVRCWFAPEDLKIGDKFRVEIDSAIRVRDKLLIILSEQSIASDWVENRGRNSLRRRETTWGCCAFPCSHRRGRDRDQTALGRPHTPHAPHRRLQPVERARRLSGGPQAAAQRPQDLGQFTRLLDGLDLFYKE